MSKASHCSICGRTLLPHEESKKQCKSCENKDFTQKLVTGIVGAVVMGIGAVGGYLFAKWQSSTDETNKMEATQSTEPRMCLLLFFIFLFFVCFLTMTKKQGFSTKHFQH